MHTTYNDPLKPLVACRMTDCLKITVYEFDAKLRYPQHEFPWGYLVLTSRGDYQHTAKGQAYECKQGTLLVLPPSYSHSCRFGLNGARCISILPDAAFQGDPMIQRLLSDHRRLHLPDAERLQRSIERELGASDAAAGLALQAATLEMIAQACRHIDAPSQHAPPWLFRVRERLHDDPSVAPSLPELAKLAGVHPAHLTQCFRRVHGVSIGEYLRRLRVEQARDALTATDAPISAIAADAGFADQSHFTRVFHRVTGETPLAWRRRTRNAYQNPASVPDCPLVTLHTGRRAKRPSSINTS